MNKTIYNELIKRNHCLYHVTELENLPSILRNGLCSLRYIKDNNIKAKYITSINSRIIDGYSGLDKYVRLAYTYQYDMLGLSVYNGNLKKPVILCIDPKILLKKPNIKYTTMNAIAGAAKIYSENDDFEIDFQKIYTTRSYGSLGKDYKDARQSEVLIKNCVETEYIKKIIIPMDEEVSINIKNIIVTKKNTKALVNGDF